MISLYTSATPNGWKITIMLEECELPYEVHALDLSTQVQFEDWYVAINPNSRIPAIDDDGYKVFESGAILHYLAEKTGKFLPADGSGKWDVLQWLHWQMANLGPMVGQCISFNRYIAEDVPYAKARYGKEARRLFEVLDRRLAGREFVCDDVSIADFAIFPWVRAHKWAKVSTDGLENLQAWQKRIRARPGVHRGLKVGVPEDEMDSWSEERRQSYKRSGATIVTPVD